MNKKPLGLGTRCVQAGYASGKGEPRQMPIIQSTTFKYETSEQMGRLFDLEDAGYFYTRLQNPTNDRVAARIAALEGGVAAMLTSSGQAANFFACFNICEAGGHIVSTASIYGGTFNLLAVSLRKLGIDVTFVDQDAPEAEIEKAFRPETRLVFSETVSNPGVKVLDIEKWAKTAHAHGVPLIVDNTFPTPIHCRPFEWGADIVVHSTTKYLDGHGSAVGGAIIDSGKFDWNAHADKFPGLTTPDESYHGVTYTERFGLAGAFITKATAQLMRDFGSIQSPQNAFYINLGLQTLHVRVDYIRKSARKVAEFLASHPMVAWINYSDLPTDPEHALQEKYLPDGSCGVMAFGLKGDRAMANKFMDSLKLITIETHVADCYSCILHPASHTHRQLTDEQLREAGIPHDLMRLSIGLEDTEDIIDDIRQALDNAC
jgi:O-acetylhomoserine (thiol)-lyase